MTEFGVRCDSSKKAFLFAQGWCIEEKGDSCFAYNGVGCSSCPKQEEGLARRKEKYEQDKQDTVLEKALPSGKIGRILKRGKGLRVEIGKKYSDAPDMFFVERFMMLTEEDVGFLAEYFPGKD